MTLQRTFASQSQLADYCREQFPESCRISDEVSETRGGIAPAEHLLSLIDPERYSRERNFLEGHVTRLSPYIRHGIVTLAEVRRRALSIGAYTEKFISELAWRDYWQRLYAQMGDGVWADREGYKTGFQAEEYADRLPDDCRKGETGLACMDAFAHGLHQEGYLHNHARLWMAAYVVHHCRVKWQAGAKWFLEHLLDGDPASNNLSWQWVASTFANKPYFFNRENLQRYTNDRYCATCCRRQSCPFDATYEELAGRLFRVSESS